MVLRSLREEVDIVIVGCGYMGQNAIVGLLDMEAARILPFRPIFRMLVDGRKNAHHEARAIFQQYPHLRELWAGCRFVQSLDSLKSETKARKLLLYHAASVVSRFDDYIIFRQACPEGIFLAEKPFVLNPLDLSHFSRTLVDDPDVFCNFSDCLNPAFVAFKEHTEAEQIVSVDFYRASSIGVRLVVGAARVGIEGGSLFDKASHDVALASQIAGEGATARVTSATFPALCVSDELTTGTFRSVTGATTDQLWSDLPDLAIADAACDFTIEWSRGSYCMSTRHLASWVGPTDSFPTRIDDSVSDEAIEDYPFVFTKVEDAVGGCTIAEEEIRMFRASTGSGLRFGVNLLNKCSDPAIGLYVTRAFNDDLAAVWVDEPVLHADQYVRHRQRAIATLICRLVEGAERSFGAVQIALVHKILSDAREIATEALQKDPLTVAEWYRRSLALVARRIGKQSPIRARMDALISRRR